MPHHIGLLVFPNVQQLDLTGPYEVFAMLEDTKVHLVARSLEPIRASTGLMLQPTVTYEECPQLDVVCVPGGIGIDPLMTDEVTLDFLRRQAKGARFVTSVCTGALVLGAAGLLEGRRATTHWAVHDLLKEFGATPVKARVVRDENLITGGGVTAGIDFGLTVAAELAGREKAEGIQLYIEYAPDPPFDSGDPETAPTAVLDAVKAKLASGRARRSEIVASVKQLG